MIYLWGFTCKVLLGCYFMPNLNTLTLILDMIPYCASAAYISIPITSTKTTNPILNVFTLFLNFIFFLYFVSMKRSRDEI